MTCIQFFPNPSSFWFVTGGWEGKVAFYTKVSESLEKASIKVIFKKTSHQKDIVSIDVNSGNILATASMDNIISFWNTYNITEAKKLVVPFLNSL